MKWIVPILCLAAVCGCNKEDAGNISDDAKSLATHAGAAISGMTLAAKVNTALALRKDVDMSGLHIEAKDGTVTVSGHVANEKERRLVLDTVNGTKGVDKLVDQLRIAAK
jgi:osmotically-inducible protein OsmY